MKLSEKIEMKKQAKIKAEKAKKVKLAAKGAAVGAAVGVTAGAVGGVLFAPKSGKETREDIKNASAQAAAAIADKATDAKIKTEDLIGAQKEKLNASKEKVKEYLASRKSSDSDEECCCDSDSAEECCCGEGCCDSDLSEENVEEV